MKAHRRELGRVRERCCGGRVRGGRPAGHD
jgi:hypothetical protein